MSRKTLVVAVLGLIGTVIEARAAEMRVREIPIPDGATDVSYMKRRGDVRFQVPSDFKTAGNFYAKKLAEAKWTKSGKDNLQRNFWVQTFALGKVSLEVRVDSRGEGSEVRLTPKGMMWDEDDQPTPKDLPLPKDATEIEYDDFFESIELKSSSNVKEIAESLTKELGERKWTKDATPFDTETFVRLKFTQGKSSLDIDIRAEDSGSEVKIRTKGMQWDGMKAEIARAKKESQKESQKVAAGTSQKKESPEKPLELPKRKEKPDRGIDTLPKLPSEAELVMDGTTYKLTSVIAYEVFENDKWSTKIVATQKPVSQQYLLASLKKTGTDKGADDSSLTWPQPHIQLVLDDDDQPQRLSLLADGTPGGESGSGLSGTALVENGRARGTVALKKPGSFFKKVYTAEISFDVPVLTRDSIPAKRLTDAPRLVNSGKLTIGNNTWKLPHVTAYEMQQFDKPMTTVVLSEKPLDLAKLKAALGKKSADDYFEFTPQVKLVIDPQDSIHSMHLWADNTSVSGSGDMAGDVVIEDGRARGTVKMTKPGEFFDKKYTFDVTFDVDILGKPASPKADAPATGLVADSHNGLPFPEGGEGYQSEGSKFRKQTTKTVPADLQAVIDFYRHELAAPEWTENKAAAKIEKTSAKLSFTGASGGLVVQLKSEGNQTAITLISRDAQAAKAAGLLPASGKARLVIGNGSEKAAVIAVNKRDYKLAAGAGASDPKTGLNWEVAPGKFKVEIKLPDEEVQTEELTIGADEAWGLIILPTGGTLPVQLY